MISLLIDSPAQIYLGRCRNQAKNKLYISDVQVMTILLVRYNILSFEDVSLFRAGFKNMQCLFLRSIQVFHYFCRGRGQSEYSVVLEEFTQMVYLLTILNGLHVTEFMMEPLVVMFKAQPTLENKLQNFQAQSAKIVSVIRAKKCLHLNLFPSLLV